MKIMALREIEREEGRRASVPASQDMLLLPPRSGSLPLPSSSLSLEEKDRRDYHGGI